MLTLYQKADNWINQADAILITASNGWSISEGFHIFANDQDFKQNFGYFEEAFGIQNIVQGAYYPFGDETNKKAFHEAMVSYMITNYNGHPIFQQLQDFIQDRDHFILTSNVDTHFQLNGFDDDRIFEIEGNLLEPGGLDRKKWQTKQHLLNEFLDRYQDKNLLILELGIGAHNRLIKKPIMDWMAEHPCVHLITFNLPEEIHLPLNIAARSLALEGPITKSFKELQNVKNNRNNTL